MKRWLTSLFSPQASVSDQALHKELDDAEVTLDTVVPRLKRTEDFLRASREITLQAAHELELDSVEDHLPFLTPWVGDLSVAYAVDTGSMFRFLTRQDLARLTESPERLHQRAVDSLNRASVAAGFRLTQPYPDVSFLQVEVGDNLAAATILDVPYWDTLADRLGGTLLFVLPHRDFLCLAPDSSGGRTMLAHALRIPLPQDNHALSQMVFVRQSGRWQTREAESLL